MKSLYNYKIEKHLQTSDTLRGPGSPVGFDVKNIVFLFCFFFWMNSQSHDQRSFLGLNKVPVDRFPFKAPGVREFVRQLQGHQLAGRFNSPAHRTRVPRVPQILEEGTQEEGQENTMVQVYIYTSPLPPILQSILRIVVIGEVQDLEDTDMT